MPVRNLVVMAHEGLVIPGIALGSVLVRLGYHEVLLQELSGTAVLKDADVTTGRLVQDERKWLGVVWPFNTND